MKRSSLVKQCEALESTAAEMIELITVNVVGESNGITTLSVEGEEFGIHRSDFETETYYQQAIKWSVNNCKAIRYHNDCIENAMSTAIRIEIRSVPPTSSGGEFIRKTEITDHDTIKWLLEKFELPVVFKTTGPRYHKCRGNIKLTIFYDTNEEHRVGYDHGHIMMPISNRNIDYSKFEEIKLPGPGGMDFKQGVTAELNQFLKALGFSEEEIGIEKKADPDPRPYLNNAPFEGEVRFPSRSGLTF